MQKRGAATAIVLAEDDPAIRTLFKRTLTGAGYDVLPAMDVEQAMDFLRAPGIAAAILDMLFVNSGGLSGLDLLRYIRGEPSLVNLPVIVLTGFTLNHSVIAEVELLGAKLWQKPIRPLDLLQRLNGLVPHSL